MQHLLLVDETFDLNFTQEYHLSIQFSLDGFSFCIRDGIQNKYIYLFHKELTGNTQFLTRKLKDIYTEFEILEADFKTTTLLYSSPGKFNLIPDYLFSEGDALDYYQLNHELEEWEMLYHLPLQKFKTVLQVAIPKKAKVFFQEKHPGTMIQNDITLFLDQRRYQTGDSPLFTIHLYKNQLTIGAVEEKILFCNSFYYTNENDLLYYMMNVANSLQRDDLKVFLNGRVNKRSAIYHRLRQYFKDVVILERTSDAYFSYLFDQLPDARFVNLLNNHA